MPFEPRMGDVCVFENEKAGHDSAPDHRGYFVAHRDIKAGEKIQFALWSGRPGSARSFGGRIDEPLSRAPKESPPTDLFGNPLDE
ncbi:hypothetical protein [Rhizobium sp. 2MFCol3.1]|uniref:hypothetical protein n=1 Tax=Rhizobium sp. 2MFCol3.1 TaxID=1246459 RepID=UPI00037D4661|nr:hypothetical protein [Rhizobium sp. 2MFCol3.1]